MVTIHVDVIKNRPYAEKEKIKTAIVKGISTALKKSKNISIKVYEKNSKDLLKGGEGTEKFTLVFIPLELGNTNKRRKNMFNEVAKELKKTGLNNNDIYIMFG